MQQRVICAPNVNTHSPRVAFTSGPSESGLNKARLRIFESGALAGRFTRYSCKESPVKDARRQATAGATSVSSRRSPSLGHQAAPATGFGANSSNARRQTVRSPPQQAASTVMKRINEPHMLHVDPSEFDLSYWHYKPWWWQPPTIVLSGVAFVIAANLFDEACIKTTLLACCTVGVWWGLCLYALPRSFRSFATEYIESHNFPENQLQMKVQEAALCCVETMDEEAALRSDRRQQRSVASLSSVGAVVPRVGRPAGLM